jgi:tRNA-specific 2-thiouridylase
MSEVKTKKVIVAMSGGIDSSVAAALLKNQGYEVVGVFMHFWHDVADKLESIDMHIENRCCSRKAEESARKVAQQLGLKFYSINVSKAFKKAVVDYFLSEYNSGRTPNPCVECNRKIKFGVLIDKALAMNADYIATGHYVRLRQEFPISNSKFPKLRLLKAKDKNKDQSYFLYTLNQKKLRHCLFPIGDYQKSEVRKLAKNYGLEIHDKKESQEICFIQTKYYGDFLKKYLKLVPGKIIDENGNILGSHKGFPLYTVGQRRDIGIGGTGPYYVIEMDRRKNYLIVSNKKSNKNLFSKKLVANKVNWISGKIPRLPIKIRAKIRYRMDEQSATVNKIGNQYIVKFFRFQRAIMPGQSVAFYKGSEVIGGGIIKKPIRNED